MDENVSKAVAAADAAMVGCGDTEGVRQWQTIRARLVELEAENEKLQAQLDAGTEAGWHALRNERDALQAGLAAADALLQFMRDRFGSYMDESDKQAITAHLSEPRT